MAFPVVIESSSSTSTASSEPPTRPSSPANNSNSTDKVLPAHKYTSNAPAPLQFSPEVKRFFPNWILCHSGSICGYSHRLLWVHPRSRHIPLLRCRRLSLLPLHGIHPLPPTRLRKWTPPTAATRFLQPPLQTHLTPFASFSSSSYNQCSSADAQIGIGLSIAGSRQWNGFLGWRWRQRRRYLAEA